MFEKVAEEYVRKIRHDVINWDGAEPEERFYNEIKFKQAYLAGAEFSYSKANEWHYPSKSEYPKECKNVLCYCKVGDVKFYSIGHTIIGGDNKVIRWWSSDRGEELKVYAWKEIVPPKEIKEK